MSLNSEDQDDGLLEHVDPLSLIQEAYGDVTHVANLAWAAKNVRDADSPRSTLVSQALFTTVMGGLDVKRTQLKLEDYTDPSTLTFDRALQGIDKLTDELKQKYADALAHALLRSKYKETQLSGLRLTAMNWLDVITKGREVDTNSVYLFGEHPCDIKIGRSDFSDRGVSIPEQLRKMLGELELTLTTHIRQTSEFMETCGTLLKSTSGDFNRIVFSGLEHAGVPGGFRSEELPGFVRVQSNVGEQLTGVAAIEGIYNTRVLAVTTEDGEVIKEKIHGEPERLRYLSVQEIETCLRGALSAMDALQAWNQTLMRDLLGNCGCTYTLARAIRGPLDTSTGLWAMCQISLANAKLICDTQEQVGNYVYNTLQAYLDYLTTMLQQ